MYKIKIIINNLKRYKKINLITFITLTLIIFLSFIALTLISSTIEEIAQQSQIYGNKVTIEQNPEHIRSQYIQESEDDISLDVEDVSTEVLEDYANSDYVSAVEYMQYIQIYNTNLSLKNGEFSVSSVGLPNSYQIIGMNNEHLAEYLASNDYELSAGTYPENKQEIVVSENLLSLFDIEIGDSVNLVTEYIVSETATDGTVVNQTLNDYFTVKIVGSYTQVSSEMSKKIILTNLSTYDLLSNEYTNTHATYLLKNYQNKDLFVEEINEGGLPQGYYINEHLNDLSQKISPLEHIKSLCTNIILIVIALGALIIFINSLVMRHYRKDEIKILRALGQSRIKTTKQFVHEIIVIFVLALIMGLSLGFTFIEPVGTGLIHYYAQNVENQELQVVSSSAEKIITPINQLSINIKFRIVALTILMEFSFAFLSVFAIANYIRKYRIDELIKENDE